MKKSLLAIALMTGLGLSAAGHDAVRNQAKPFKAAEESKIAKARQARADAKANGRDIKAKAPSDGMTWYAAIQTFTDYDYNFTQTDGLIDQVYEMKVRVDGNKVTISNFLNYDDEYMAFYGYSSIDVTGTYDSASGTITIPTPYKDGSAMTMVGTDGYTDYALMAGTQDKNQDFWPIDHLTLHVVGDFERIYTEDNIGAVEVYDSQTGYLAGSWASLTAQPSDSRTPIVAIPQTLDFGELYPRSTMSKHLQLLNLSGDDVTYAVSCPEGVGVDYGYGEIWPMETAFLTVEYTAGEPGEITAKINVEWETASAEGSQAVGLKANIADFPDYYAIVSEGEFSFATGHDAPFVIKTGEEGPYAESSARKSYQKSWLEATFSVPDNHVGKLSYKGQAYCTDPYDAWANHSASVDMDGETVFTTTKDSALDGTLELEPGEHKLLFTYSTSALYYETDDFRMEVSDLSLRCEAAAAEGVEVLTPVVDFGGLLLDGPSVAKTAELKIMNTGSEPLGVTGFESSDPAFSAVLPEEAATLRGVITVPVTLTAKSDGEYTSEITVMTTAGVVQAEAKAMVRIMPDFSALITDEAGVVSVATDENHPFMINAAGTAYNANSGDGDLSPSESVVTFTVTVPEGKMSHVSWTASCDTDPADQVTITVNGPIGMDLDVLTGQRDASSETLYSWKPRYLEMVPGTHTVEFRYFRNGDGTTGGEDMLAITSFKAVTEDCDPQGYELSRDKVRFADCVLEGEGHNYLKTFQTIYVYNTGYEELRVLEPDEIKTAIPDTYPFDYRSPGYVAQHGNPLMIDLIFAPQESGWFDGEVIIPTTFGNITVEATGNAYTRDGMILCEDFADSSRWDLPGEGSDKWYNVADRYGYRPDLYCFSGSAALMSNCGANDRADSHAVSPEFSVPADGGMLTWWAAPGREATEDETYEVCIVPASEYSASGLAAYAPTFTDTLTPDDVYFRQAAIDLAPYAGSKVRAVFHHTTLRPGAMLRIDDVYAYTASKWGAVAAADMTAAESEAIAREYYTIDGIRTDANAKGLVIVVETLSDGSVRTAKTIR